MVYIDSLTGGSDCQAFYPEKNIFIDFIWRGDSTVETDHQLVDTVTGSKKTLLYTSYIGGIFRILFGRITVIDQ